MVRAADLSVTGEEPPDAYPPDLTHNIWFWSMQTIHWIGYAFITLLFMPWAIAMHLVILALAIPFGLLCCWRTGRKGFIYFYVVTVMLPGKFIWFNFLIKIRRRGKVWDFEMGRPRPIPLESRRRLSEDSSALDRPSQSSSAFLCLPPEIRVLVYREIFVGGSDHLHIVQRKTAGSRTKPPTTKIQGYLCAREHSDQKHASCSCMLGAHAHHDPPHASELELPKDYNRGKLAVLQTCRQVYSEAIEMMYREPKFCFNNLEMPPFFLRSVLPNRLALIQRIQLCYKQSTMTSPRNAGSSVARYIHKVQQCTFCNLTQWLQLIKKYMTGLRQIEVFLYLDRKMPVPKLGHPWIVNLLKLQIGPTSVRTMTMKVFCNTEDGTGSVSDYRKEVKDFMRGVQMKLKQAAYEKKRNSKMVDPLTLRMRDMKALRESTTGESQVIGPITVED